MVIKVNRVCPSCLCSLYVVLPAAAAREVYTECRQVVANEGVAVYAAPCNASTAALVWPAKNLPRCSRLEYVVGDAVSNCYNSTAEMCQWIKVRYQDEAGRLQIGWVTASCSGSAAVAECPADACLTGMPRTATPR
jgi:hypothetical protein